jgi:LSD1 subclass zinc finger protein
MEQAEVIKDTDSFGCTSCGAELKYKPGSSHLKCEYCGAENDIPVLQTEIEELDFNSFLDTASRKEEQLTIHAVKCESCGANSSIDSKIESTFCAYCGSPLIEKNAHDESVIRPKWVLPFKLEASEAKNKFKNWINKLWFVPTDLLKAVLNFDHFKGIYLPYWTYDSKAYAQYVGQRGEHYYVDESYMATENGQTVRKNRRVQRTRWHTVSGAVDNFFDDIMVCASTSVPANYVNKLEPWDTKNLVSFDMKYLSGFVTEKYQIDLTEGFGEAKRTMENQMWNLALRDIGGDDQRIITINTNFENITFKHILLPAYISSYNYKGKLYRFLVNARTGEVQGERPWSSSKIALAIVGGLAVIMLLYLLLS